MGNYVAAADAAAKSGSSLTFPILIVLVFIGFYFLMIRPQRRRQQQAAQKQNTVTPGAQVRTTAGMYGTVIEVDGDDVILEIAPGVDVRLLKRAIMEVITPGDAEASEPFEEGGFTEDSSEDETSGTNDTPHDVESAEDGHADSPDDLAKSDKDNVF
jgi:preprotein translocase subunit YajC